LPPTRLDLRHGGQGQRWLAAAILDFLEKNVLAACAPAPAGG
jgi:hypothetical protein